MHFCFDTYFNDDNVYFIASKTRNNLFDRDKIFDKIEARGGKDNVLYNEDFVPMTIVTALRY